MHPEKAEALDALGRVVQGGALIIYLANNVPPPVSPCDPYQFVDPDPVVLQTPIIKQTFPGLGEVTLHEPQDNSRFGRAADVIEWEGCGGVTIRGIVVGEPDASVFDPTHGSYPQPASFVSHAGRAFLFLAPFSNSNPECKQNAWGKFVLMEPADTVAESMLGALSTYNLKPTANALFGAHILGAKYTTAYPHDQFVVAARERAFGSLLKVGQGYSFHVPIGSLCEPIAP